MKGPSLALPLGKRVVEDGGDSGGRGGFSERSPSPPRPLSPEERMGFGLTLLSDRLPLRVGRGFLRGGCGHGG